MDTRKMQLAQAGRSWARGVDESADGSGTADTLYALAAAAREAEYIIGTDAESYRETAVRDGDDDGRCREVEDELQRLYGAMGCAISILDTVEAQIRDLHQRMAKPERSSTEAG